MYVAHVDPEIVPVRPYAPTNDIDVRFEGNTWGGEKFVKKEVYQASARSLSDVEEDEHGWAEEGDGMVSGEFELSPDTVTHRSLLQRQLENLPKWLAYRQQGDQTLLLQPHGCVPRGPSSSGEGMFWGAMGGDSELLRGGRDDLLIPELGIQVSKTLGLDDSVPPSRPAKYLIKADMMHANLPAPKVIQLPTSVSAEFSHTLTLHPKAPPPTLLYLPSATLHGLRRYPPRPGRTSRTVLQDALPVRRVSLEEYLVKSKGGKGKVKDKDKIKTNEGVEARGESEKGNEISDD